MLFRSASLGQYDKVYESMDNFEELNGWTMWGGMVEMAKFDYQLFTLINTT